MLIGITYLVRRTALALIGILQLLMLVSAVMSWVPQLRQSRLYQAISMVLEPLMAPVRSLLFRIPGMDRFPLDLSFLAVWLLLSLVAQLL